MTMRILHVLDHSVPLHSGYTFRTLSILKEQRARGWDPLGLTTPKQGASDADEESVSGFRFLGNACASAGDPVVLSSRGPHPSSNADAPVIVVEYADFQCPSCRTAHATIVEPLLVQYGARIRYELKHFPLMSVHPLALEAAEAAECAGDQGKFWEYTDIAFERQRELSREKLLLWDKELSLDAGRFEQCVASDSKRSLVLAEYKEGLRRGVEGTTTFFVNGEKVQGKLPALQQAIEAGLAPAGAAP